MVSSAYKPVREIEVMCNYAAYSYVSGAENNLSQYVQPKHPLIVTKITKPVSTIHR